MPKLRDLLSASTDTGALIHMSKAKARAEKKRERQTSRPVSLPRVEIPDFVALDLETTGLEAKTDRVIEVGALKFLGGKIVEEFSTFVNPGISIPGAVTDLTGIRDQDVASAPPFSAVAQQVLSFIGNLPLCGHQIDFDLSFLNEEVQRLGMPKLQNEYIDTALLSRIAMPGIAAYSLTYVADSLGITLQSAHRALDDARAAGLAASSLLEKTFQLPAEIRRSMARFAPASLFKSLLNKSLRDHSGDTAGSREERPVVRISRRKPVPDDIQVLDVEEIKSLLDDRGPLGGILPGFVRRDSQVTMAVSVAEALNESSFFMAEAGTGTGKSLAYLLPAALFSLKNDCRVLVSTHTRNLQDQLVTKDLPIIARIVGNDLTYCVLKGRSNYLCLNRFHKMLAGIAGNLSNRERAGVLPLIRWAQETSTGDIEEQSQFNRKWYSRIWNLISAESHGCMGRRCPDFGTCFFQQARRRALGSHIVVINHALFFSDVCAESSFLGQIGCIVFDEAHHIEACGHRALRVELDTNRLNLFFEVLTDLNKSLDKFDLSRSTDALRTSLGSATKRARKGGRAFLEALSAWAAGQNPGGVEYQIPYRDNAFSSLAGVAGFPFSINELQDILLQLQQALPSRDEEDLRIADVRADIESCLDKTSQLKADCAYLCAGITDDHVFWIEGNQAKGWTKLCGVPLDISSLLGSAWASGGGAAIFTSATLSTGDSMGYFGAKFGLAGPHQEKTRMEVYPSPFGAHQAIRCALRNGPDPDSPDYPGYLAGMVAETVGSLRRNALVLFTSNSLLQAVYSLLRKSPLLSGFSVLAQNLSGNRNVLLNQLRRAQNTILLGTDSFWEGVDAPGESCELVIITRLPFTVPTHPVTKAIAERHERVSGDSFFSYSVPEALIKFRQGAGRLIRTATDRGALVVADGRILSKGYGKRFVASLPGEFTAFESVSAMVDGLRAFFGSGPQDSGGSRISYVPFDEVS